MITDTEALRQAFEEFCVEDGYAVRSEYGLYWYEPYDEGVLLSLFEAGHAAAIDAAKEKKNGT